MEERERASGKMKRGKESGNGGESGIGRRDWKQAKRKRKGRKRKRTRTKPERLKVKRRKRKKSAGRGRNKPAVFAGRGLWRESQKEQRGWS